VKHYKSVKFLSNGAQGQGLYHYRLGQRFPTGGPRSIFTGIQLKRFPAYQAYFQTGNGSKKENCQWKWVASGKRTGNTAIGQGFSNYGSRPQMGWRNVFLGSGKNWLDKSNMNVFVNFTSKR